MVHYEVLPDRRRDNGSSKCSVPTSSEPIACERNNSGSHDDTFDSMEIPLGGSHNNSSQMLHYKVLHDREGHYSYAYDTSLSPAFLIRKV